MVEGRRQGKRVFYRRADDSVTRFLAALRKPRARLPEVEQVARAYFVAPDHLEPIGSADLIQRLDDLGTHCDRPAGGGVRGRPHRGRHLPAASRGQGAAR